MADLVRGPTCKDTNLRGQPTRRDPARMPTCKMPTPWSTVGNGRRLKSLHCGGYDVAFTHDVLPDRCKRYPIKDWFEFDDETISSMDGGGT